LIERPSAVSVDNTSCSGMFALLAQHPIIHRANVPRRAPTSGNPSNTSLRPPPRCYSLRDGSCIGSHVISSYHTCLAQWHGTSDSRARWVRTRMRQDTQYLERTTSLQCRCLISSGIKVSAGYINDKRSATITSLQIPSCGQSSDVA